MLLLTLPFLPLLCFLVSPTKYAHVALFLLPVIAWSAIDNALLTKDYLDPISHLSRALKSQSIKAYIDSLYNEIGKEVASHQDYLSNREKFQIPSHEWSFAADTLGLKQNDLWDKFLCSICWRNGLYRIGSHRIWQVSRIMILFNTIWSRIEAHAGQRFVQIRGGKFTYVVASGHVIPDRTNQQIPKSHFEEASKLLPLKNTVPVQHLRGPSYI